MRAEDVFGQRVFKAGEYLRLDWLYGCLLLGRYL
jgi:hypothetical protein